MFVIATNVIQKRAIKALFEKLPLAVTGGGALLAQSNRPDRRCALRSPVHHRYPDSTGSRLPAHQPRSASTGARLAFCSTGRWSYPARTNCSMVSKICWMMIGANTATVHPAAIASAGSSARGQSPASAVRRRAWCPFAGYGSSCRRGNSSIHR